VIPVAVTAVGVVSAFGVGAGALDAGLRSGESAIRSVDGGASVVPWRHAAAVPTPVGAAAGFPDDRKVALLFAAAGQLGDALAAVAPARRGVFLGTGLASMSPREAAEDVYPHAGPRGLDRAAAARDRAAGRVAPDRRRAERATLALAAQLGARGAGFTSFSACAASAEAIAAAARAVARGDVDVAVAGGHDSMLHPLGFASFQALGALGGAPARPFDVARDGFTLGEGAAVLLLEPAHRARAPLAWLLGAGASNDAWGITAPPPEGAGAEAAMGAALADAGIAPADIGWVKAHATGTPVGDAAEAAAIRRVFGEGTAVVSLKGAVGHTLAASGALELVAVILGLQGGYAPGTAGCRTPDAPGLRVLRHPAPARAAPVVCNSFGFGGQNVSLIVAPEAP
jgi:3-oxoacyl-[acyl-carrier-protein] synthase II